ncbi:hypothetical protein NQ314_021478 [Rhamnusium bicolor]|uniref:Uncharacterized protein n=1 Tax=Rhamnusium bicolor TaxID=1586634 RepID=A0AAV8WK50_9CUCU|nr:hypothetical protein NQ314_021478 [Rhamnusium bicolor]
MVFRHFLVAALALAMVCFQLVESERDQYENRHDKPHAVQLRSEATDSMLQVSVPQRPAFIEKETNTGIETLSAVGNSETGRKKRGFSRWNGQRTQLAGYESFTMWKPPVYQLSRPYYIPIYGTPGRVPIYFPPQSLNINPGTPVDNPLPNRPFTGPGYLPPKEYLPSSTSTEKVTTMKIIDRINGDDDDDDDDRPIWGDSPPAPAATQRPSNIVPTRPTRPPSMADFPPLVHDVNNSGTNILAAESQSAEDSISNIFSRPPQRTTPRPAVSGPSNCVWAIISCCSAANNAVPDSCFEQRGCPGPFWGSSPCDSDYAKAAISAALNYYNQ